MTCHSVVGGAPPVVTFFISDAMPSRPCCRTTVAEDVRNPPPPPPLGTAACHCRWLSGHLPPFVTHGVAGEGRNPPARRAGTGDGGVGRGLQRQGAASAPSSHSGAPSVAEYSRLYRPAPSLDDRRGRAGRGQPPRPGGSVAAWRYGAARRVPACQPANQNASSSATNPHRWATPPICPFLHRACLWGCGPTVRVQPMMICDAERFPNT